MKALTLTQPWATLVATGEKLVETRGWTTPYRGRLAIHAAKHYPFQARALADAAPFRGRLDYHGATPGTLRGPEMFCSMVLATARLVDVLQMPYLVTREEWQYWLLPLSGRPHEYDFGEYAPGRYAFVLTDLLPLPTPTPARGSLGLWEWTP
jgi:hypothetical protein